MRPRSRWFDLVPRMIVVAALAAKGVAGADFPGADWPTTEPADVGLAEARLLEARDYALTGGGSGMIIRQGRVAIAWGDQKHLYDLKSSSKAIGVTLLGLALQDGKVKLSDRAVQYQPEFGVPPESNRATGWIEQITLQHLATQTAGFEKPGGYGKLLFAPGTMWHYSDAGPNWLAECLTLVYGRDLREVMFERVLTPIGITPKDITWRENAFRPKLIKGTPRREFGSGFSADMNAMARIGYLYLHEGRWRDRQIIPAEFVRLARQPVKELHGLAEYDPAHGNASEHYGLLWWNNGDGTLPEVPRDAFWSWGLYDSFILVIPSLDLVVVRAGQSWPRTTSGHYDVLRPFFGKIALAAARADAAAGHETAAVPPPYPPSPVIRGVTWAPKAQIVRRAVGSDNWPMAWADDDALYTAYGDGNGFEPFVPAKLSLGFGRVTGNPPAIHGENIAGTEFRGDGAAGRKASGMLMVDSTLYLLARNLNNSQLGWSQDHGATWSWADWTFTASFGCPSFLNFGRNYAGARDEFVYLYSPDAENAYVSANRMVMARVPKARIKEGAAYEYFAGLSAAGEPAWTRDVKQRGAVFTFPGHCYRGGVTYAPGLKRYLWCQVMPQSTDARGPRFQGGFGIYDAPEPWGPWTTAFFNSEWDTGPGESSSLPTKWMSPDGSSAWLVFSGNDSLSLRQVTFDVRR